MTDHENHKGKQQGRTEEKRQNDDNDEDDGGFNEKVDEIIEKNERKVSVESDEILMVVLNTDDHDDAQQINDGKENVKNINTTVTVGNGTVRGTNNTNNNNEKLKKNVTFKGSDLAIEKFIGGEEIIDKENPFKSVNGDTSVNYRFIKKNKISKKSSIPAALPRVGANTSSSDYITKEEILRQSKYVPTYVKNPDAILTYDKSIIGRLSSVESEVEEPPTPRRPVLSAPSTRRIPIPAPRRIEPARVTKVDDKKALQQQKKPKKQTGGVGSIKYPDISQIRVKTGTDIEETLYDPNEVAINVIKFDKLLKSKKVKAEEDSDEPSQESEPKEDENGKEDSPDGNGKNLTNTVTSSEFKDFLRKKGLILVPARRNSKTTTTVTPVAGEKIVTNNMTTTPEKKSNILKRIFLGFNKKNPTKLTAIPQKVYPAQQMKYNQQPIDRRIIQQKQQQLRRSSLSKNPMPCTDDGDSSISSLLSAADEQSPVSSPVRLRRNNNMNTSMNNTGGQKPSKLQQPLMFTKRSPSVSRHVMRPTAQKMSSQSYLNNYNSSYHNQVAAGGSSSSSNSLRKKPPPAVPSRMSNSLLSSSTSLRANRMANGVNDLANSRSSDKLSNKINVEAQLNQLLNHTNGDMYQHQQPKTSTPKSSQNSSELIMPSVNTNIASSPSPLHAYMRGMQELKRQSDAELLQRQRRSDAIEYRLPRRPESCQPKVENKVKSPGGRNYDLIRGSPLRSTLTGAAPLRTQSALDGLIPNGNSNGYTTLSSSRALVNATPTRTLDKKQIMNELYAFYRRSVNNTPVTESELYSYPVEFVKPRQPMTNPRFKASQPQSSHDPTSKRYVVFDSDKITPMDVIRHRSLGVMPTKEPVYRNLHMQQQQKSMPRPSSVTPGYPNHYQLYNVSDKVRYDGRSTPLILSSPAKIYRNPGFIEPGSYGRRQQQHYYNGSMMPNQRTSVPMDPRIQEMKMNGYGRLPLPVPYESDTASEAGEVQKIFRGRRREEDWQNEKSANRNQQNEQAVDDRRRSRSREDPRRHTLGAEMMHYANNQGGGGGLPHQRSMDLEVNQRPSVYV